MRRLAVAIDADVHTSIEWRDGTWFVRDSDLPYPKQDPTLACPVRPSKVVAIAKNYRAHAAELNSEVPSEPLFFLKPSTAVIGPGDAIRVPPQSALVHHEGELGVVLAKPLTRASKEEALAAICGYTCLNDVTARDIQRKQSHFTQSKGFDTFCPIGPWIVTGIDPSDLRVVVRVNGEVRQDGRTSQMVFDIATLLSHVSHVMTLLAGDVLATGTPAGVGPLVAGDEVEVEIENVGTLRNRVVSS